MSDSESEGGVNLPRLYKKAANAKRALTRAKKEFQNALKALVEASSSQHFFQELIKAQDIYKAKRVTVFEIYDQIEDIVSEAKFVADFSKQTAEIEKDFDSLEEQTRLAISAHHNAVTAISANTSQARASTPRAGGAVGSPKWKLESSFEPKLSLKLDMSAEDSQNWERQFRNYFDISNLKYADIDTQRAVLMNCLHPDLQVKIYEALSGMADIKEGLALIKEEFKKCNPRVVRRHQLFSLEQRKDEYKFSDTVTRMETLAKNAEITDMSKDSILCHLMLRACQDEDLRTKLLEVDEDDMTVVRLKDVIQRFETIQATNKGLNKKEMVRRAATRDGNICYRCQEKTDHQAAQCPVDAKTLFCQICHEAGKKAPHLHNTFPTCKSKELSSKKAEDKSTKKEQDSEDSAKPQVKTKRVNARDLSPAGDPESSADSSDGETVQARQARARDRSPAGLPCSSTSEDEGETDSGWAWTESVGTSDSGQSWEFEEKTEEEDWSQQKNMKKLNCEAAMCNGTPATLKASPASPEPSTKSADLDSNGKGSAVLGLCNPRSIWATIILVVLLLGLGGVDRLSAEEDKITNGFMIASPTIIMLLFGFLLYYKKDKEKNMEKVGAIRKSGQEKKKWKKRKRSKNKKEGEFKIEAAPSDDSDPEEIEA